MKTIIVKDGFITGFGTAYIDPQATKGEISGMIEESTEFASIVKLQKDIKFISDERDNYKKSADDAKKQGDTVAADNRWLSYQLKVNQLKEKDAELGVLFKSLGEKKNQLMKENAVYFECKSGESIIPDIGLIGKFNDLKVNECLDIEGLVKPNFKGCKVWIKTGSKWALREVLVSGEALISGEILEGDLSDVERGEINAQTEVERVLALTAAEKLAELESVKDSLASQAALMRSKLEIQGIATALEDSQAWYQTEVDKAVIKYS